MKKKVVVIGSGIAGSVLCNALVKHAEVILLEIGCRSTVSYPHIGFDRKNLAGVATFCYGGGGTTNLWHNGLIPINRGDVLGSDFGKVLTEAQAYTDEAASTLFFRGGSYSAAYKRLTTEMAALAERAGFSDGIDCLLYPKHFTKLTVDAQVGEHYSVSGISFVPEGRRIKTVQFTTPEGRHSVDADQVIIAAGAMGSPKLVLDMLTTLGKSSDAPGIGFIDHPIGFVGKVRFRKEAAGMIARLSLHNESEYSCRSAIRLKSTCGRYTCCVLLRPAVSMENDHAIYKYKSLLGASTGMARVRNALSWKILHPDILAEIYTKLFELNIPTRTYGILFIAEQKRGRNRVYHDGSGLRIDWAISAEEMAVYRTLLNKLREILLNSAESVNIETNITEEWLWSGAHHACTTSLGDGPEDLVDRDLRLKASDNVYVCDASVIQEHSYANPGLTIASLALRLAERLTRS
jgi:hypothetical protein